MNHYSLNSQYVYFRREYFGGILSDVREANFQMVNHVAATLIEGIHLGYTIEQICSHIQTEFEVDVETLNRDLFSLCDDLVKGGYLTTEHRQNRNANKEEFAKADATDNKLIAPIEVNIYPHYECNQACEFCYVCKKSTPNRMKYNDYEAFIAMHGWRDVLSYNILGGEPFLRPDLLLKLLDIIPSNKKISISTNGSCSVPNAVINKMAQLSNVWVQVSLESHIESVHDAIVHQQGAFVKANTFIDMLRREGIRVVINTVITDANIDQTMHMAKFVKEKGASSFSASLCFPGKNYCYHEYMEYKKIYEKFIGIKEELKTIEDDSFYIVLSYENLFLSPYERSMAVSASNVPSPFMRCHGGNISVEINPSGDVYPCGIVLEDDDAYMGNVLQDDFHKIWNENEWDRVALADDNISPVCVACAKSWGCYSGCPIVRKNVRAELWGTFSAVTKQCE